MRETAKALARALATLAVLPALISFWVRARLIGRNRALEGSTQALSLIPGLPGQYLRRAFLGRALDFCHPTSTVEFGTLFSQSGARLEEHAYVGPRCHLGLVHVERDVLIGAGVHVPSGSRTHGTDDPLRPIRDQPGARTLVRIGAGSWIGSAAVVLADVGRDAVVAAGAVVTRPVPDRTVVAGVPARVIGRRPHPSDEPTERSAVSHVRNAEGQVGLRVIQGPDAEVQQGNRSRDIFQGAARDRRR
jgi:acetyltransferase-like isoleucine patch superfamily enzyme